MKRLKDNVTSSYFEAANKLKPKAARRRIVAYVEAYDDVFFWRTVLSAFENDDRYFEVMLPSRLGKLERGKKAAMMKLLFDNVGSSMIACVDADYDYLMQGATPNSVQLLSSPYVLHTYAYAIENLQCYGPSLRNVCVAVTLNDRQVFDCAEYLRQYSQAIFPLFVWNVWGYRNGKYHEFNSRVRQLQLENPDAKESYLEVKDSLKALGVTADTTYLYIQGHHLFDKVVVPMMKKVCDYLVRQRQSEISRQSQHSTQKHNELSCYNRSVEDIEGMLRKNVGYVFSEPFQRIQADVARLFPAKPKAMAAVEAAIR